MANYSLIINSRFRPFEYQELLAPVLMATQAHQAVEEAYGDLDTKASVWDEMANAQTDPKAHAQYKKYADDLRAKADQLSRYGLNAMSRREMLDMRSRYAKEITPIEQAYARRKADIDAQKEALVKDPTHFFNRMAKEISLDEYMDNQGLDVISDNYSGALLTQQVGQAAANLKNTLMKKGALTALGLPYQYERMLQYGASADEVFAAMSKDPKALPILTKLVDDVMASSGIRNWSSMNGDWQNNAMYKRAEAFAMQGLYNAIGTSKIDNFTDSFSMQDALNARQHARAVAEQRRMERVAAQERQRMRMYDINPTTYYSASEIASMNKASLDELDKWRNKGYFNSKGQLTNAGFKALNYRVVNKGTYIHKEGYYVGRKTEGDLQFLNWAKKHGVTNPTDNISVNILNRYYAGVRGKASRGELVTGTANFDVYRQAINGTQDQSLIANKVSAVIGEDGKIYRAGSLQNGTIRRGKGLTQSEWRNLVKDNPVLYVTNSPTTGQQLVELSNGQKFLLPPGILGNDVVGNLSAANQAIRNSGSAAERATYLNLANSYLGSILTTNTGTEIKPNDGTVIFDIGE